jgi:hypothetical protein
MPGPPRSSNEQDSCVNLQLPTRSADLHPCATTPPRPPRPRRRTAVWPSGRTAVPPYRRTAVPPSRRLAVSPRLSADRGRSPVVRRFSDGCPSPPGQPGLRRQGLIPIGRGRPDHIGENRAVSVRIRSHTTTKRQSCARTVGMPECRNAGMPECRMPDAGCRMEDRRGLRPPPHPPWPGSTPGTRYASTPHRPRLVPTVRRTTAPGLRDPVHRSVHGLRPPELPSTAWEPWERL